MEAGGFIDRSIGADVSYHAISWQKGSIRPSSIKTGGNIHYHVLPLAGTVEQSKDFAQILFVLSGALRHRVNGETQELSANSVVFLRPDDFHSFLPPESESSCEIIILAFELEMLLSLSTYLENDVFLQIVHRAAGAADVCDGPKQAQRALGAVALGQLGLLRERDQQN